MRTIRRADARDAAELAELMTQLGYQTSAAEMAARMQSIEANANFATFVALDDAEICGMIGLSISASYEHNDRTGQILVLVVNEQTRGRGAGRELVAAAENYFRENNIMRIVLTTRLERADAHRFYEALGFQRTGWRFGKNLNA